MLLCLVAAGLWTASVVSVLDGKITPGRGKVDVEERWPAEEWFEEIGLICTPGQGEEGSGGICPEAI